MRVRAVCPCVRERVRAVRARVRGYGIVFVIMFFCSDSRIKEANKKRTGRLTTCQNNPDLATRVSLIIKPKVTTEADFRHLRRSMKRRQLSQKRDNMEITKTDTGYCKSPCITP